MKKATLVLLSTESQIHSNIRNKLEFTKKEFGVLRFTESHLDASKDSSSLITPYNRLLRRQITAWTTVQSEFRGKRVRQDVPVGVPLDLSTM